ncbi:MAG: tetratricopeptide repeat protein [Chloroflexi bacterium]|nr:tetratricopeptide repeat protein [Chloroflexota bacterium]
MFPTGTVTFLFTDIEGSTKLWENHPEAMKTAHARHNQILQAAVEENRGYVFQIIGDSFCCAFQHAEDAVRASILAQSALQAEDWGDAVIKVRMGIHTGNADIQENGLYQGYLSLSRVQRLMSAGHGGQTLLSRATQELVRGALSDHAALRDMGEKRLKDLTQPENIFQLVIPDLPTDFPPLKTLDIFRNNLPAQTTAFIGRENEIAEVKALIANHRIVTLTGSGGAGKTRLSLQAGAECLEAFTNGVWFVELAALTDASLITGAITSAMGLREKDSDIQLLANTIGSHPTLLILDNCEHLIESCARLVERLTQACPKLHVLTSSREALGIPGEHPYRVPSLPFPDTKHLPPLNEIAKCESVQLFVERVKTYVPSFSLTEKNASSVAQICSRLDGIPLALELAAARVKVMSVEQMASRLGDVFSLLTSGSRTALPRQQTLRALIEWSYDLLSESEKNLFRRLSVFSGGWSLEAAESIFGGEGGEAILDDLARLVDKSLVNKEEINGEARFHMLETIRQYAQFKLFASEEVEEVKDRHRDWFMQLAEEAEPILRTGGQLPWLERLEMEHDNLRAAMSWSIERKDVEQALRIPAALGYFWDIHGHYREGINWLTQALKVDETNAKQNHPLAWANAAHARFALSTAISRTLTHFQPEMDEVVRIYRESGEDFRLGHALYHAAYIPAYSGNIDKAQSAYEESLAVYERINDPWGIGACIHCLAHAAEHKGNTEEAFRLFDRSLEVLQPVGDRWSLYHPVGDTARLAANQGDLEAAKKVFHESIQTFEELGNRSWISNSLRGLARVYYLQGDYAVARGFLDKSLAIAEAISDASEAAWTQYRIGLIEWAVGQGERAHRNLLSALTSIEKTGVLEDISLLKAFAGFMECFNGRVSQGREKIETELARMKSETPLDAHDILPWFAHALWLEKDIPRAKQTYLEALEGVNKMRWFIRVPECLEGLGKVAVTENDFARATRLFAAAEAMRDKMGTPIPPVMRGDYEAHAQTLRKKLEKDFDSFWSAGRGMTIEEAASFALAL